MPELATGTPREAILAKRIRDRLEDFSKAERRVAHSLLAGYPLAGLESVATLASHTDTSGPTVLRFVKRLGFAGYSDFQRALRAELAERLNGPLNRYSQMSATAAAPKKTVSERIARSLCNNIEEAVAALSEPEYEAIVGLLCDRHRRIHLLGGRFSHLIAEYCQHYLRELRAGTLLVSRNSAERPGHLLDLGERDVVVAFDFRRYQKDIIQFVREAARQNAEVVVISDVWQSPATAYAHHVATCPVEIPSVFDSGVSALAVTEALVAGVAGKLGTSGKRRMERLEGFRGVFDEDGSFEEIRS